jgi:hypothetical protein
MRLRACKSKARFCAKQTLRGQRLFKSFLARISATRTPGTVLRRATPVAQERAPTGVIRGPCGKECSAVLAAPADPTTPGAGRKRDLWPQLPVQSKANRWE